MSIAFAAQGSKRVFPSTFPSKHGLDLVDSLGFCHRRLFGHAADFATPDRTKSTRAWLDGSRQIARPAVAGAAAAGPTLIEIVALFAALRTR
jgi:hypothetical protein